MFCSTIPPPPRSRTKEEYIFEVVAHEMAHQWFGDLVTMGWWDNIWLNEGFAEWMGQSTTDHFNPDWQYWNSVATNKDWRHIRRRPFHHAPHPATRR